MSGRKKPMTADDLEERAEQLTRRVSARANKEVDDEDDEREEPADPPESKRVVVDDEDDEDDDERDEPKSRSERRAERSRERGRIMRENEELRRRLDELERRPPPPVVVQAPPAAPGKSPEDEAFERDMRAIEAESDQLEQRSRQISARKDAAGNVVGASPEEVAELRRKWWELDQRKTDLQVQRAMQRHGGGHGPTTPTQVNQAILMGEFPDVFAMQNGAPSSALRWGHARHQQLLAEGAPNSLDTARKALREARERFGQGPRPRPAPSAERKARYESISRGGGGADGDNDRPRSVSLTSKQQAMAEERYPNVSPAQAHKLYAKNVVLKSRDRART